MERGEARIFFVQLLLSGSLCRNEFVRSVSGAMRNFMKSIEFRPAKTEDAARLTGIALAGKAYWNYPAEWLELWRQDLVVTPAYIRAEPVSVGECEGLIVGFTGLSSGEHGRHIEHLWLEPRYIGCGFGRRLFEEAVRLAREEAVAELFVESDPNAEGFYLKMGAERMGQEVYFLPGGIRREVPRLVYRLR
jgi:GNAT superfamily N-acetyltransferase